MGIGDWGCVVTKTQGSRPVLFYVAPSGANSNQVKTRFKPKFKPFEPISNPN